MKRKNKKLLTFMLAGAFCAATIGGAVVAAPVVSSADEITYTLSNVFTVKSAEIIGEGEGETKTTAFKLSDDGSVTLKNRDLALKWYGEDGAKYMTVKFGFADTNFKKIIFTIESASAWATKNDKAVNSVAFTAEDGIVSVAVNDGEASVVDTPDDITLTLTEEPLEEAYVDGEFGVLVNNKNVGTFVNVGSNYAEYTSNSDSNKSITPFQFSAELPETESEETPTTTVLLKEINGQAFDNAKLEGEKLTVTDTAAPVLVVNEQVDGFLLGTAFALEYEKIDVLQESGLTETKEYYQYNPTDEKRSYKTLSTSVYFMETVYEQDGNKTTVYKENGNEEYVSIKIKLGDKAFTSDEEGNEYQKVEYNLSWYASDRAKRTVGEDSDYIVIDRNEDGATYKHIVLNEGEEINEIPEAKKEAYESAVEDFQSLLTDAAADVYAGSNSYIYIPSVKWLLDDNNGYRNLKFTLSYKTPSSTTAKTSSSLSYNSLRLSVSEEGLYEFKIFANDKAGNTMKYYLDGELVDVTTSNIWDIKEIPAFSFEIENRGLKIDNEDSSSKSERKDTEVLDKTYTFTDVTVVGASNLKENYELYKIDQDKANAVGLTEEILAGVTYEQLRLALGNTDGIIQVTDGNYLGFYLEKYAQLLAEDIGGSATKESVLECFVKIEEFDDRITEEEHEEEWNKNNKYNWSVSSQSFKTVEEGMFVLMADYWESELPIQRVAAYKLLIVESEDDVVAGEDTWWEDNLVSVILFSVAGVLAIIIVILLLVKPSDETLEDVDKKAEKKKNEKKEKKSK